MKASTYLLGRVEFEREGERNQPVSNMAVIYWADTVCKRSKLAPPNPVLNLDFGTSDVPPFAL